MRGPFLLGIVLILAGGLILGYGHFSYKTQEKVLEIGSLQATAERTKTVPLPAVAGWLLIGTGACLLVFRSKP